MRGILTTTIVIGILIVLITVYVLSSQIQDTQKKIPVVLTSNTITEINQSESNASESLNPFQKYYGIDIQDRSFYPKTVKIKAGTIVIWTNQDSIKHTVTSDSNSKIILNSAKLSKGDEYQVTFNAPGSYSYHCSIHPYMQGNIIVE